MDKNGPKIKISSEILENLKICTLINLKSRINFKILYIKLIFRQISSKLKTSSDILKDLRSRHFVGVEYRFDSLTWTRISCDFLLKTFRRIYLKSFTRTDLKMLNTNLRLKFWYYLSNTSILGFGHKIKVSLNLHENLHAR